MSPLLVSPLQHRLMCSECEQVCTVNMLRMVTMLGMSELTDIACCVSGGLSNLCCSSCEALLSAGWCTFCCCVSSMPEKCHNT